ncbi:hypothetical protein L6452_27947 [Arctium lappa]|uniref:Uncharacterized protein n=1 Tax=Arctium lappa TaxID=4217 RepID=A0ACB9A1F8_ARCLA|nr:hypothetical protein L6452_27947 [Arctium lappa]
MYKLLYADITECKKFDVERTRPTIGVWNMELLRRREYLELNDRGFGNWPLLVQGKLPNNKMVDMLAERSTRSKKQSAELTLEKAISDYPRDSSLQSLDLEFRKLFNPQEECYMGQLPSKWKCGLNEEGPNQTKQLQVLRNKYMAKLLLSDINLRRSFVISDCEKFNALDEKERTRLLQAA